MAGLGALGAISTIYTISSDSEDEGDNYQQTTSTPSEVIIKTEVVDKAFDRYAEGSLPMEFDFGSIAASVSKEEARENRQEEGSTQQSLTGDHQNGLLDDDTDEPLIVGVGVLGDSYRSFRIKDEPKSDKETSDSESDSTDSSADDDSDEYSEDGGKSKKKREPPRVKGELTFKDLPPIEDLHISVPHEQVKPVGIIKSVVDPLVVVEALPNTPALDLDSVLFLDEGDRVLGAIFDVLGQVKQPFYCVRFNSLEHIQNRKVEKGMLVYCAPSTPHTSYVLVAQLRQLKGSDASWLDDIEPPPEAQEFSDDEKERSSKNKKRKAKENGVNGEMNNQNTEEETYQDIIPKNPLGGYRKPYRPRRGRGRNAGQQNFNDNSTAHYNQTPRPSTSWHQRGSPAGHMPNPFYHGQFQNGSNWRGQQSQPPYHAHQPRHPDVNYSNHSNSWGRGRGRGWSAGNYVAPSPPRWPHPHVMSDNGSPSSSSNNQPLPEAQPLPPGT